MVLPGSAAPQLSALTLRKVVQAMAKLAFLLPDQVFAMMDAGLLPVLRRRLGGGGGVGGGGASGAGAPAAVGTVEHPPLGRDDSTRSREAVPADLLGDLLLLVAVLLPPLPNDTGEDEIVELGASASFDDPDAATVANALDGAAAVATAAPGGAVGDAPSGATTPPAQWSCPACTYMNAPAVGICGMCGSANPDGPAASSGQATAGAAMWSCDRCTYTNAATMPQCEMCQAPNPLAPSLPDKAAFGATVNVLGGAGGQPSGASAASVFTSGVTPPTPLRQLLAERRGDLATFGEALLQPLVRIASQAVDDTVRSRVMLVLASYTYHTPARVLRMLLATDGQELPSVIAGTVLGVRDVCALSTHLCMYVVCVYVSPPQLHCPVTASCR